ncbi:MAG TPA: DUF5367 family protein [Pyrinomonadaceae bacterium]|nr:DUF5367 family protein [Pyrinomonadaceae bacterium]
MWRAFLTGILIWIAGTVTVRLWGQHLLLPGDAARTLALYGASFAAMLVLVPLLCRRLGLERDSRVRAAAWLVLPTLILDPLSCVFFTSLFPNIDPAAAGAFGGWMLICCGGGIVGTLLKS